MMTSTTTLAIGTSAGTLLTTALSALIMGALAMYTLLHHRQVFAWMQKIRRKDEENSELDKPTEWLADLYRTQCRLAQKPCRADELEDVVQIANMLRGVTDQTEAVRPELLKVVELADDYTATALPDPGPSLKITLLEHRTQLIRAMKQEATRTELARAVLSAQQKIKALRRS